MRHCAAATVPECFAPGDKQCLDCKQWFCTNHIVTHTGGPSGMGPCVCNASKVLVSMEPTNITMLQQEVVLDESIPKGEVRIHPLTFAQMATHCIRDRINGVINTKA
jgi:hypothetical protein